jgi:flagellar motor switch protein FliG
VSTASCYNTAMTKNVADKLTDLVKAVRELPDETQEALLEEFAERVSEFTESGLSDEQRDEVRRRLANPRHADPAAVRALFARHGVKSA